MKKILKNILKMILVFIIALIIGMQDGMQTELGVYKLEVVLLLSMVFYLLITLISCTKNNGQLPQGNKYYILQAFAKTFWTGGMLGLVIVLIRLALPIIIVFFETV